MSKSKEYEDWIKRLAENPEDVRVVDETFGENADVVICRLATDPLMMKDNLVANCTKCFRMVQFRPHAPKTPPKMCDECAAVRVAQARKDGDTVSHIITENTALDVAFYARKKGMH